jgi:hypothetical protein
VSRGNACHRDKEFEQTVADAKVVVEGDALKVAGEAIFRSRIVGLRANLEKNNVYVSGCYRAFIDTIEKAS